MMWVSGLPGDAGDAQQAAGPSPPALLYLQPPGAVKTQLPAAAAAAAGSQPHTAQREAHGCAHCEAHTRGPSQLMH